ncbi:ubl carboxyl-terminal hydrolase 18 isoform X2 [Bombina bombina]|uniref:ubl carboxyl-terminal hydrolase 18 isoform X2 n=1 Tax=Bombina bombina TaxID=8345 RepID=UPI00235AB1D7|nr:ubl carboxyl-terminal hydrolase 18 isoform X2 [Bombina bombina]
MYEEGYMNSTQLLEHYETEQETTTAHKPAPQWSYSTGKFKNGAVGLCNIGEAGSLNPLLQTLYMNRKFTDILNSMGERENSELPDRRFPYELLALFEEMHNSKEDAVPPYRLLRCLQILDVRLFGRYDIADLFFTLWNLLLQQLPQPHLVEKMRTLYTIKLQNFFTCRKCSYQRFTDSDVVAVPIPVSASVRHEKLPLERALRRFFKKKELSGENKPFCTKCEENTPCLKGVRLLSLPTTLTISLKRLHRSSQTHKINRAVSFPPQLDLSEVLDPDHLPEEELLLGQYKYHLFAVVAHSGTASFGHYCAYINSTKDNKWYCFNDSSVCKVSWDDVKCTYGNTSFHWGITACLLVYVKSDMT